MEQNKTVKRLNQKIDELIRDHTDNEGAHIEEDLIWLSALKAIADGAEPAQEIARTALRTVSIDFTRWYA